MSMMLPVTQHHLDVESQVCPQRFSEELWGLRWREHTPWQFDDMAIEYGSFAEALPFVTEHYGQIFGDFGDRFLADPMTAAKRRFLDRCDVFLFRAEQRIVGISIAHPTDWSTYYVRSTAFVPDWQGRHGVNRWEEQFTRILPRFGCVRVEAETSPSNAVLIRALVGLGWMPTGTTLTERFGSLLRLTRFLNMDNQNAFARAYCATSSPLRR